MWSVRRVGGFFILNVAIIRELRTLQMKPTDVDPSAATRLPRTTCEQSEECLSERSSSSELLTPPADGSLAVALKQLEGPAGWLKQMNRPAALWTGSVSPLWL